MNRYQMKIQYEGTKYRGWQRLKSSDLTVQGKIEKTLSEILERPMLITGASRTDAGVHAVAQIATFDVENESVTEKELLKKLNRFLPEDIVVTAIEKCDHRFHPRFHAISKTYIYRIWTPEYPPLIDRNFICSISMQNMDIEKMTLAAKKFVGTHDFKAFSNDKTKKSSVRTIESIEIISREKELNVVFTGDGFLYNMIRIIMGTLVEVAKGEKNIDDIETIMKLRIRENAGEMVEAKGLTLANIKYK